MSPLSDEALERLLRPDAPPELVAGRYRVLREIGRGGMGAVWLAEDRELDRRVALKVVAAPLDAEEANARLRREAGVLARLEHPGIVPVHDVGVLPDGRAFAVMKYVDGERLDRHVKTGTPLGERLELFLRIAETVAFAHAHGTLHRDLKPANVMLGPFGEVLVLDWGVAKALGALEPARAAGTPAAAGATADGTVVGTPGWMSPEQERGALAEVDERSDVYGLGALLWFLLTGAAPPPPDARDAGPRGVPAPLRAIARRALAARRAERYPSALELARDVRRYLAQEPVSAWPEGPLRRARRLARKHRALLVLLLAYLVVRAALLFWQFRRGSGAGAG